MIKEPSLIDKALELFFKIFLPALVGVSVKIAVKMSMGKEKLSWFTIMLAYIAGVGVAYLASPLIVGGVSKDYVPAVIGIVAISGDKIAEWFIYKFNVDGFLTALIDTVVSTIKNKKKDE